MSDQHPFDPLDLLRAADPVAEATTPRAERSFDALFDQITTTTPSTTDEANHDRIDPEPATPHAPSTGSGNSHVPELRTRRRWRPSIALPAAAAVAAVVVGGVILVDPGNTPSASALVHDAAVASAGFESGRAVVAIEIEQSPGDDASGKYILDYRFDGGDFSLQLDATGFTTGRVDESEPAMVDDMAFRGVGDDLYSAFDGTAGFVVSERSADTESIGALFGFQPTSVKPSTVVELLERTDDFRAVTSDDGVTTYRGSVTVASLEALGPSSLPAGLSLLADSDTRNDDLPDTLGVDVVVTNGVIDTLTIDLDGETPLGYSQGTITTTFSEYGQPQNIVAPPADQVTDDFVDTFPDLLPEGFQEAVDILDEVNVRRPGLCADVFGEPDVEMSDEEALAEFDAFPACLEAAGEQAAADAFRSLSVLPD